MVKYNFIRRIHCALMYAVRLLYLLFPRHTGFYLKHTLDPVRAGQCLGDRDDQVRQLHQLDQDLGHIVDQRHHLTLGDGPLVHPHRSRIEQHHCSYIDNDISDRIGQRGDLAHKQLHMCQCAVLLLKCLYLFLFLVERPDDPGACKILSGGAQHTVQPCLHFLKQRHCPHHNAEYHNGKRRDRHHENKGCLHIYGKRHHHSTEHDKGRTQEQAQYHVHAALYLVHIGSHPRDHGSRPQRIDLRVGQSLNMSKQRVLQFRRNAYRSLRRKILRRNGTGQSDYAKHHQHTAHTQHIGDVAAADSLIDDRRHHERYEQLEGGFQHLKKRRQYRLFLIIFYIYE